MSQDVQSRLADGKVAGLVEQHFGRSGELAALPGAVVHDYGKATSRNGRKMGHVTRILGPATDR